MIYDTIVVGGGPAGITAAIYVKRANKSVAILEKFAPGGQLNLLDKVANYPGFTSIEGAELAGQFRRHAKSYDIPFIFEEVKEYDLSGEVKKLKTRKNVYEAKSVIFAMGCHTRPLGIEGEESYKGRGLSYCAVCDGHFYKDKIVAVVGNGDTAVSDCEYLSDLCQKVYLLSDGELKLNVHSEKDLTVRSNVEIIKNAHVTKILGEDKVTGLTYEVDGRELNLNVDGIFVAVGRKPDTENLCGQLDLSSAGFICSDGKMHASQAGVFVCGDVREGSLKQISVAVGEGAIAGTEAGKYVSILNARIQNK